MVKGLLNTIMIAINSVLNYSVQQARHPLQNEMMTSSQKFQNMVPVQQYGNQINLYVNYWYFLKL